MKNLSYISGLGFESSTSYTYRLNSLNNMFWQSYTLIVALGLLLMTLTIAKDLILAPSATEASQATSHVALLFAPGMGIGPDAYSPLIEQIQHQCEFDKKALWIGVPQMTGNITTIGLGKALKRVADELTKAGLPDKHGTIYAGHSVGGALLPYVVKDSKKLAPGFDSPEALVLMASFLVREFRTDAVEDVGPGQYEFPTKVMTIGGELDGLARVTRMAEAYYNQIATSDLGKEAATKTLPVTVVEGVTHMQFASGEIPQNVLHKDLVPEVSYDAAHRAIASDVAAFVRGLYDDNWADLESRVEETGKLVEPIVDALLLEGYHQFKPPCYCEAVDEYNGLEFGTCPPKPGCQANAPWTETAQQLMTGYSGAKKDKELLVQADDSQHIVTEEDPSCHLPHIHSATSSSGAENANSASGNPGSKGADPLCDAPAGCTLKMTTVTQLVYQTGSEFDIWRESAGNNNFDTGYWPVSASEMKAKMKSRQAMFQAANDTDAVSGVASFDDLDAPEQGNCAAINAEALKWAMGRAAPKVVDRYNKLGQKYVVDIAAGDKKVCVAGPCWIWASLEYQGQRQGEEEVTVMAPSFAFKNQNPYPCDEKTPDKQRALPCTAGMHYCKLLSPARVIEWMYVDSNRLHNSLAAQSKQVEVEVLDEPRCCDTCPEGTDKYYSIPNKRNCGESCIAPADVDKYQKFEPGLTRAETNTPCADNGYPVYIKTETHGKHTPVEITVDFFHKE
jgi:hypothetical protein